MDSHAPPLRVRFEVPRSEVDRARGAPAEGFDREHLRGRVHFDVNVPFEPDPILDFLRERRHVATGPPYTSSLDQPVAFVLGQLAAATVLAAHGESAPMTLLAGGAGALCVAREDEGTLAVSLPLERYAGVALVPTHDAARAVAAAARSLTDLVRQANPDVSAGPFGSFLAREAAILEAVAARGSQEAPQLDPVLVAPADLAVLPEAARSLEAGGLHVLPYWTTRKLDPDGRRLAVEPVVTPHRPGARGALALAIGPSGVRLVLPSDPGPLGPRLARPVPCVAVLDESLSAVERVEYAPGGLPMAPGGSH